MTFFLSILFWAGIVMLLDGAFGLLFEEKWARLARGLNIRKLALIEITTALGLLALHYLLPMLVH